VVTDNVDHHDACILDDSFLLPTSSAVIDGASVVVNPFAGSEGGSISEGIAQQFLRCPRAHDGESQRDHLPLVSLSPCKISISQRHQEIDSLMPAQTIDVEDV